MKIGFYNIQGGTGKTTISTNMAYYLSKSIKTVYVDCDIYGGTSALLFGLEDNPNTLNAYLNEEAPLEEVAHIIDDTLTVIVSDVSPNAFNTDYDGEKILELLTQLESIYDVVIYDLPPGISEDSLISMDDAGEVLSNIIIVAEDGMPSIANALKTQALLDELNINRLGVIVNKDRGIVSFEDIIGEELLGILPFDNKVEEQWMDNEPIVSKKTSFSKELISLTNNLAEAYLEESIAAERALLVAKSLKGSILKDKLKPKKDSNDEEEEFDLENFDVDEFDPRSIR